MAGDGDSAINTQTREMRLGLSWTLDHTEKFPFCFALILTMDNKEGRYDFTFGIAPFVRKEKGA